MSDEVQAGKLQTKAQLVAAIKQERADWEALLQQVDQERMYEPGVMGTWNFKDVVAHLTAWRRNSIADLEEALQGGEPLPPPWAHDLGKENDTDRINEWIYNTNRDRPLEDVLSDSRRSFDDLQAAVEALSERDLTDPNRFAWTDGEPLGSWVVESSFSHLHDEHEAPLRAWIDAGRA